jgi:hypothetical protein
MIKYYSTFDAEGFRTGTFPSDIYGDRERVIFGELPAPTEDNPSPQRPVIGTEPNPDCTVPPEAIEITEAQWRELIEHQHTRRFVGGEVVR